MDFLYSVSERSSNLAWQTLDTQGKQKNGAYVTKRFSWQQTKYSKKLSCCKTFVGKSRAYLSGVLNCCPLQCELSMLKVEFTSYKLYFHNLQVEIPSNKLIFASNKLIFRISNTRNCLHFKRFINNFQLLFYNLLVKEFSDRDLDTLDSFHQVF